MTNHNHNSNNDSASVMFTVEKSLANKTFKMPISGVTTNASFSGDCDFDALACSASSIKDSIEVTIL